MNGSKRTQQSKAPSRSTTAAPDRNSSGQPQRGGKRHWTETLLDVEKKANEAAVQLLEQRRKKR